MFSYPKTNFATQLYFLFTNLYANTDSGIQSLADLKGKKIGAPADYLCRSQSRPHQAMELAHAAAATSKYAAPDWLSANPSVKPIRT